MIAAGETDNVVRIPLEQAQELMLRYTGLALSDTEGVGLDSLRYLSEYNAYYRVGDEAEASYCRILSGWHTADGLTVLQYDGGTVTLRQLDGRWVFVSNVLGRSHKKVLLFLSFFNRRKQWIGAHQASFRYFCYSPAPFIFLLPGLAVKQDLRPLQGAAVFWIFSSGFLVPGGEIWYTNVINMEDSAPASHRGGEVPIG